MTKPTITQDELDVILERAAEILSRTVPSSFAKMFPDLPVEMCEEFCDVFCKEHRRHTLAVIRENWIPDEYLSGEGP